MMMTKKGVPFFILVILTLFCFSSCLFGSGGECNGSDTEAKPALIVKSFKINDSNYAVSNVFSFYLIYPNQNYLYGNNFSFGLNNSLPFIINAKEMVLAIKKDNQIIDTIKIQYNTRFKYKKYEGNSCDFDEFFPVVTIENISFKTGFITNLDYYINEK